MLGLQLCMDVTGKDGRVVTASRAPPLKMHCSAFDDFSSRKTRLVIIRDM